jgi:hypothetical protein
VMYYRGWEHRAGTNPLIVPGKKLRNYGMIVNWQHQPDSWNSSAQQKKAAVQCSESVN